MSMYGVKFDLEFVLSSSKVGEVITARLYLDKKREEEYKYTEPDAKHKGTFQAIFH